MHEYHDTSVRSTIKATLHAIIFEADTPAGFFGELEKFRALERLALMQ
jgi:hypothetical protein